MEIQVFKQVASVLFLLTELPQQAVAFALKFFVAVFCAVAFPPGWSRLQDLHVHWQSEFTWIDRMKVKKSSPRVSRASKRPKTHAMPQNALFCCITLCPSRDCARRHFGTAESWKRLFQHVDRSIQELLVSNQATNLGILLKDLTVKVC